MIAIAAGMPAQKPSAHAPHAASEAVTGGVAGERYLGPDLVSLADAGSEQLRHSDGCAALATAGTCVFHAMLPGPVPVGRTDAVASVLLMGRELLPAGTHAEPDDRPPIFPA